MARLQVGQRFALVLPKGSTATYVLVEKRATQMGWDLGCQTPARVRWYTGLSDSTEVEVAP